MFVSIPFLLAALVAIVVSFWSAAWGWGVALIAELIILVTLWGVKQRWTWNHIPELSEMGNQMLQRYGHFYTMPFAARDFSSASSAFQIASFILGAIDGFKGEWWGVGLAVVNFGIMTYAARAFNPTVFITDPLQRIAHEEVIAFVMASQRRAREQRRQVTGE